MARPRKKAAAQEKRASSRVKPVEVVRVEIYQDAESDWRYRVVAANNRVVSSSGEGFRNRHYARKVAHDLFPLAVIEFH